MATKILLNRTMNTPLVEQSINMPRMLSNASRKRSATFLTSVAASSEPQQPSNKKPRTSDKGNKSVRFDASQNTQHASSLPLTDASIDARWFSAEELHQIRFREANVIKIHKFCDYYLHQMTSLLGVACGASDDDDTTPQVFVAKSPARGLEKEVLPCVRQRRKEVIQTFLKSQRALKLYQHGNQKFTPEFQLQALSKHYIKLARPSLRLAQLIAQGDAMVALESDNELLDC